MENTIEERLEQKGKKIYDEYNKHNTFTFDVIKEREKIYNSTRKTRIRKEIFNVKNNFPEKSGNNIANNNNDIIIENLNIDSQLKNEKYINELISSNKFDEIFKYIKEIYNNKSFNIDLVKYGLFMLNEKLLNLENNNLIMNECNFINNYNFKEIIMLLFEYSKNENKKLDYDPIILNLTYQILANFCYYYPNNEEILFLFDDKFLELHIYFFDLTSEKNTIKNILLISFNICCDNNEIINKILTFDNKRFFNLLIQYINNYQNDNEIIEIILDLFIFYINIFNNYKTKIKKEKDDLIEMKDNTINCDWNIVENIFKISLLLLYAKQNAIFTNALYLISTILKKIYKSNNIELVSKFINDNNTKSMILFILEKDYKNSTQSLIYLSDIIKYIIKLHSKSWTSNELKLNIINLINDIQQNLNENDEIIDIFIYLLTTKKVKLKEKIKIKLIEVISAFLQNEYFYKDIIEYNKNDLFEIIFNYINSSNYDIRKKIIKIVNYIINKRDFLLIDYLVKNKILYNIKNAIDPTITYCNDEKLILGALNIINNLLSIGELFKKLHRINTILVNFENIGGKELLDNLLCNKSEYVYNASLEIIERYFN